MAETMERSKQLRVLKNRNLFLCTLCLKLSGFRGSRLFPMQPNWWSFLCLHPADRGLLWRVLGVQANLAKRAVWVSNLVATFWSHFWKVLVYTVLVWQSMCSLGFDFETEKIERDCLVLCKHSLKRPALTCVACDVGQWFVAAVGSNLDLLVHIGQLLARPCKVGCCRSSDSNMEQSKQLHPCIVFYLANCLISSRLGCSLEYVPPSFDETRWTILSHQWQREV